MARPVPVKADKGKFHPLCRFPSGGRGCWLLTIAAEIRGLHAEISKKDVRRCFTHLAGIQGDAVLIGRKRYRTCRPSSRRSKQPWYGLRLAITIAKRVSPLFIKSAWLLRLLSGTPESLSSRPEGLGNRFTASSSKLMFDSPGESKETCECQCSAA